MSNPSRVAVFYSGSDIREPFLEDMWLNSNLVVPYLLIVMAMIIAQCAGIIKEPRTKSRRRTRPTTCTFDNKNYTIGKSWHPYLAPRGINFCIICKCQKGGFTHCARVKCKQVTCPGQKVPPGKCCPVCPGSTKQCRHEGKHYYSGQVWETATNNEDKKQNSCAECSCHNKQVACAIRICPTLRCLKLFQVKERDSCCMTCRGRPIQPEGEAKDTENLQGSCFDNGRYYKNGELWNPINPTSGTKLFQYPNCQICSCNNANVTCNKVTCPKLACKNPIKKNFTDCCESCPGSSARSPIILRFPPFFPEPTSKADHYPNCEFDKKTFKHNTSWSPQIPEIKMSHCVRCTCMFSKVKCVRIVCKSSEDCAGKCFSSKPKSNTKTSGQRQCLWERVRVNLLVSDNSRKTRSTHPKQNSYLVKIALIKERSLSVEIHEWNVKDNQATVRTSKIKNSHFAKSSTQYTNLGETKNGRLNRFFNREKLLAECNRKCINKAKDYVRRLKNRVRYFKKDCRPADTFPRLMRHPS